ncbi:MAG: cytochrome c maturation protein CcmE [Spirochaetia bacterium]|nr:cytochrome c maturation protein CcmE [Spirochaetia bacterium]
MKYKVSIVVVAIVAGIAFMVISSISKDTKKFYQLTELAEIIKKDKHSISDKYLIVLGNVKEGSVKKNGIQADFTIEMADDRMKVHHNGKNLLPDTFQAGAQVTVEGKYDLANDEFVSDKVMAKCASKYQSGQTMTKKAYSKQDK